MNFIRILTLLIFSFFVSSLLFAKPENTTEVNIKNIAWQFVNGSNINTNVNGKKVKIYFRITDYDKIRGFSACNRFVGDIKLKKNTVKIKNAVKELKVCDSKTNTIEDNFLKALGNVKYYEFTKQENLVLINKNNDKMVFKVQKEF